MPSLNDLKERNRSFWKNLAFRLSTADELIPVSLLGAVTGLLAGAVIIAFRIVIEESQLLFLPGEDFENYEGLPTWARLLLPLSGGLIIGLLMQRLAEQSRQTGVVHVMRCLIENHGKLPLRNMLVQFCGAAISIISGHSVGREGPGIHLGAASGSLLGQVLLAPHNTLRTLVACGVAAAIAASFNTPLAGVIFSMEVIVMEYTIMGFVPVILAAVVATTLIRSVYGSEAVFDLGPLELGSLLDLPFVVIMAAIIGTIAALFITSLRYFSHQLPELPFWKRTTIAGGLTGICAVFVPQIMGIGYDTVNASVLGHIGIGMLTAIVLVKLFATTAGIGLGLPGGLIGPTIVIGAAAGAALGGVYELFVTDPDTTTGFYALLGMGAMMSATLNAPLAALTAILELTGNPNIILPGMLAIIVANLTCSQIFGRDSIFLTQLKDRGINYKIDPISQHLRRVSVASVMEGDVTFTPQCLSREAARQLIENAFAAWLLVETDDAEAKLTLIPNDSLRGYLANLKTESGEDIDLLSAPVTRLTMAPIALRASLQEALTVMLATEAAALYVTATPGARKPIVHGILTREDIEKHYRYSA